MTIGEKVRQIRTQKMMTQSELAGDFITRNMLSRIENGFATPSLQTLLYIAERLGVPAGYFIAEGEEESIYRKIFAMPDMVRAYTTGDWEIGCDICDGLDSRDNETALLGSIFAFNMGKEAFLEGDLFRSLELLDKAWRSCESTVYPIAWLKNIIATYIIGICDISTSFDTSAAIPNEPPYTDGSDEFCTFYRVYRKIVSESRFPDRLPEGTGAYAGLIRAAVFVKRSDRPRAYTELRAVINGNEEIPVPVIYYAFRDMENCCREMSDFKGAYEYAALRTGMLEKFLTRTAAFDGGDAETADAD